jgi:Metallopeptidase toxin 4
VVVGVVLAVFTGGASAVAEAANFAEKATALLRLIARETLSVVTVGIVDILQLFRVLIAKFVRACARGWEGFAKFLEKLLANKADDVAREEGRVLDDIEKNIDSVRLAKLKLEEWIAEIRKLGGDVKFYTDSKEMIKHFRANNVGAAFESTRIPPTLWIRKEVSDLEMFHESMHFEDFLRRGKENYLRGTERKLLPFGNKPPVPINDLLISKYIKEKYVLEKILEEQAAWIKKYGYGRFTESEIEFSKKYFMTTTDKCLEQGIDIKKITIKL